MNATIAAVATPPGRGGVAIVRLSGPLCKKICNEIIGIVPKPRFAHYASFLNEFGNNIDKGVVLFFESPRSFTGEDVLELHAHGGPIIVDMLLKRAVSLGAKLARAGEFSERAFLNNKIDLVQAESIAQLISASTEQAAMAAMRSLQGEFSATISNLVESLIHLRLYVEASIDFPEEDVNFLADPQVSNSLDQLLINIDNICSKTKQGILLDEGVNVVIVGHPNAGKSTLLNTLTGQDTAIVTPVAGTTRDIVKAHINLDGVLLNVIDTAGLRVTDDLVEKAGIKRTWQSVELADLVLVIIDSLVEKNTDPWVLYPDLMSAIKKSAKVLIVYNKIDQTNSKQQVEKCINYTVVSLSAHTGEGIDLLRTEIKSELGMIDGASDGGVFLARRRHLDALLNAKDHIIDGKEQLEMHNAGELLAEELKYAQLSLSEITGEFTSDDLLGRIFSEFCIGK